MNTPTNIPIFVAEDEEAIQSLLDDVLTEAGFAVTIVSNGEEAMAALDRTEMEYRALITDVNFQGMLTGWDVAKRAREINDALPVIYITGASAHEWASKGVSNSLLLKKPFAFSQIVTAVSQLLNAAPTFPSLP